MKWQYRQKTASAVNLEKQFKGTPCFQALANSRKIFKANCIQNKTNTNRLNADAWAAPKDKLDFRVKESSKWAELGAMCGDVQTVYDEVKAELDAEFERMERKRKSSSVQPNEDEEPAEASSNSNSNKKAKVADVISSDAVINDPAVVISSVNNGPAAEDGDAEEADKSPTASV